MKITTPFLFFFVVIFSAFGQKYQPMLTEGSTWHEYFTPGPMGNETFRVISDTIINGVTYKKIFANPYLGISSPQTSFLREDTLEKKVYELWSADWPEDLIYDFSLTSGDTFYWDSAPNRFMVLDSISDTIINPFFCGEHNVPELLIEKPRVFYFDAGGVYGVVWVEGIGSLAGLSLNYLEWGGGASSTILCHYNEHQERDFHYIYCEELTPCEGLVLDTKEIDTIRTVKVFPNPALNIINVDLKGLKIIKNLEIVIYDLNGIEKIKSINNHQINVNQLIKGIYFIKVIIDNQQIYIRKIIKQ